MFFFLFFFLSFFLFLLSFLLFFVLLFFFFVSFVLSSRLELARCGTLLGLEFMHGVFQYKDLAINPVLIICLGFVQFTDDAG